MSSTKQIDKEIKNVAQEYGILGEDSFEIMTNLREQITLGFVEEEEDLQDLFDRYTEYLVRENLKTPGVKGSKGK